MKTSDKIFLVILGVAGLGGILIFGIKFMLQPNEPTTSNEYDIQKEKGPDQTRIVPENQPNLSKRSVFYMGSKFTPQSITIQNKDNDGCILSLTNQDLKPLLIRLSPHSEKDDRGVLYPEILPGESMLIDPRYRIPEIAFHNHKNPHEEFRVVLGESCVL